MKKLLGLITCAVILCTMGASGAGNEFYWALDNLWSNEVNWETGIVPTTNDDVLIQQDLFLAFDYLDLSGTTGTGLSIKVGVDQAGVTNTTFGITNGSLIVGSGVFEIAQDPGSDVSVELTNLTKTGFETNIVIGGLSATGTLTVANADIETQGFLVAAETNDSVGAVNIAAGTVTIGGNGLLVASADNSYAVVALPTVNQIMNTTTGNLNVANAQNAYGSLTIAGGTSSNYNFNVGNGIDAVGILTHGGTIVAVANSQVGASLGGTGTVTAVDFTLTGYDEVRAMSVGAGENSYGKMTVTNLTFANKADLELGEGSNSVAIVDVDTLTLESESGLSLGTGEDSTVILNYNTLVMPLLGDFTIGVGGTNYAGLMSAGNSKGRIGVTGTDLNISANTHDVTSVAINDGTIIQSGTAVLRYTGGVADDDDILVGNIDGRSGSLVVSTTNGWVAGSGNVSNDAIRVGNSVDATGTFSYEMGDLYAGFNGQSLNVGSGLNATGLAYIKGLQVLSGTPNILCGSGENAKGTWTIDGGVISNNVTRVGFSANSFGSLTFGASVIHAPPGGNFQIAHAHNAVGIMTNLGTLTAGAGGSDILIAGNNSAGEGENAYGVLYVANADNFEGDQLFVARQDSSTGILHIAAGTISFDNGIIIANSSNSYAEVTFPTLTTYNPGGKDFMIGNGGYRYAKITADGGTIDCDNFNVANGNYVIGIANLGTATITAANTSAVGGNVGATGTASAASFTLNPGSVIDKTLNVADAADSVGSMTLTGDLTLVGPGTVGVVDNLADGTALNVASANGAVGAITADTAIFSNGIKQIHIGNGVNANGSLNVNNIIIDGDVGRIRIGSGNGAVVTLSGPTVFSDTGMGTVGDIEIGPNVSPAAAGFVNQFSNMVGFLSYGINLNLNRGAFDLSGVRANGGSLSVGGTASLNYLGGSSLGAATIEGVTAVLDLGAELGVSGDITNFPIDVATAIGCYGELIYTNGTIHWAGDSLNGGAAFGASFDVASTHFATGTVHFSSVDNINTNNYAFNLARGTGAVANVTFDAGSVKASNFRVADGVESKGTFTMNSGVFSNWNTAAFGNASGAVAVVTLDEWNMGSNAYDVLVGNVADASGTVTANSGFLDCDNLQVANAIRGYGKLVMSNGSIQVNSGANIGGAAYATGIVEVATATFLDPNGLKTLDLGGGTNAYGRLTVTTLNNERQLNVGAGFNAVGVLEATTINQSGILIIGEGEESTGSVTASNMVVSAGAGVRIATGKNSSGTLTVTEPILMSGTNGMFFGMGAGSLSTVNASFTFDGPIGNFGVGEGTSASTIDLFSQNDTYGTIEINDDFSLTNSTHWITGITQNGGTVTVGGSAVINWLGGGDLGVATIPDANAAMDLGVDWGVSGAVTSTFVNVGRATGSVGSFTYTNGNLHVIEGGALEAGTVYSAEDPGGNTGTVLLKSMTVGTNGTVQLSVANVNSINGSTGSVTVLEDASVDVIRVARGDNSVGTVNVGGTLSVNTFLNVGYGSNSVGIITAGTFNRRDNQTIVVAADGQTISGGVTNIATDCRGSFTAGDGTVAGSRLSVANRTNSEGVFTVTNGTLKLNNLIEIGSGSNSKGVVLVGSLNKTSQAQEINIGTGSNATASLTIGTADILKGSALNIGTGAGTATGTLSIADGTVIISNLVIGAGSTLALDNPVVTIRSNQYADVTALVGSGLITGSGTTTAVDTSGWSTVTFSGNLVWGLDASSNTVVWAGIANAGIVTTPFEDWAAGFGLSGSPDADPGHDFDGDFLSNLAEYGVGGDPSDDADTGYPTVTARTSDGGTNYLQYIYTARTDDAALSSYIELVVDMVGGTWTNNTSLYDVTGTFDLGNGFGTVTNRIPTDVLDSENVRLRIDLTE